MPTKYVELAAPNVLSCRCHVSSAWATSRHSLDTLLASPTPGTGKKSRTGARCFLASQPWAAIFAHVQTVQPRPHTGNVPFPLQRSLPFGLTPKSAFLSRCALLMCCLCWSLQSGFAIFIPLAPETEQEHCNLPNGQGAIAAPCRGAERGTLYSS